MKKIILLLSCLIGIVAMSNAQTAITGKVAGSLYLEANTYVYYWGAATDTLVASDTLSLDLRVRGEVARDITLGLYVTKVSGTVSNSFVVYSSIDGVNYTSTGDTITLSNASTGLAGTVNLDDYNAPYLRIKGVAGATAQKAWYKLFAISRNE
jgi:hypothetical protein